MRHENNDPKAILHNCQFDNDNFAQLGHCPSTVLRAALWRAFMYKDNGIVLGKKKKKPNRTHDQCKP